MISKKEQNQWKAWYESRMEKINVIQTAFYIEGEEGTPRLYDQGRAELIFKMRGDPKLLVEYTKFRTGVGDSDHFIISNMKIKSARFGYAGRNLEPDFLKELKEKPKKWFDGTFEFSHGRSKGIRMISRRIYRNNEGDYILIDGEPIQLNDERLSGGTTTNQGDKTK